MTTNATAVQKAQQPDIHGSAERWTADRPRIWWAETPFVLPRKGAISKLFRRAAMSSADRTADIAAAPDRAFLKEHVFPDSAERAGDILFVGVRAYTRSYYDVLEAGGGSCWTIDVDPAAAAFGRTGRHATSSVLDVQTQFGGQKFATVLMLGVLGFGVNRRSEQLAAILACGALLTDNGVLILSWNDRRLHYGVIEDALLELDFTSLSGVPPRLWVARCDQQFAFLRRRPGRPPASVG